ncbi:PA2779 family protein [Halomonas sp. Bachu 37]|uniref:PA2779 family protein n=1 Tax=Halomonas kashgarensis TaxID=3084920 RepID=UPI003217DCF9
MTKLRVYLTPLLIIALLAGSFSASAAPATISNDNTLISTQEALSADNSGAERERIHELLARADVQDQLLAHGVSMEEVHERVAALSDAEAHQMAEQLEQLPAGAGAVGALFAVFVILLITDILGLTDVYPFTR